LSPTVKPKRVWKGRNIILWTVLSAVVVTILLTLISDLRVLKQAIKGFPLRLLIPIALLSLGNYILRYIKWHWYLILMGHRIRRWPNLLVFLSGFALTVTPGKIGEFVKAFITKKRFQVPYTVSTAVLLMERFTDVVALLVLICTGITLKFLNWSFAVIIMSALLGFLMLVRNRSFVGYVIGLTDRVGPLRAFSGPLRTFYEQGWALLDLRVFTVSLVLSIFAWFLECVGYALVAWGFGVALTLVESVFIYSSALVGGVLTLFFGGLGATEGGMVGLGMAFGMSASISAASTIIIRVMTLWYAVVIGWMVFLFTPGLRSLLREAREEKTDAVDAETRGSG
jgi:uncharacterized protein (TIRG00374 family)